MSINFDFSHEAFRLLGTHSPESDRLSEDLQRKIAVDLRNDIFELGNKIATKLNNLGHLLTQIDSEIDHGRVSITFADDSQGSEREHHQLRFDLDVIVSVGFPGYSDDMD